MNPTATENLPEQTEQGHPPAQSCGWFKAMRGEFALELIRRNRNAYILATVIAHRARWREGFNADGLALGEAMLGDCDAMGMSEQEYRTAKAQLKRWGFATFKPTNKGTLGKLIDTRLFSVLPDESNEQSNRRLTDSQRLTKNRRTKKYSSNPKATQITELWLGELSGDPAYQGLSIPNELAKARRWCKTNHRECTCRFFVNWLNRCHPPPATTNNTAALQARISNVKSAMARETNPEAGKRLEAELEALLAQVTG